MPEGAPRLLSPWVRVTVLLALLTLAASDRALTLWAGACAAALALGGLLIGPLLDALAVSQSLDPGEVFAGEAPRVHLRVTNRSVLPLPALRCEIGLPRRLGQLPPRWLAGLAPGETLEATFRLRAGARGVYHLGSVALEAGDWFGLWRRQGTVDTPLWLTVYPRPLPAHVLPPPPQLPAGERHRPSSPFRAWEPAGLRPYRRGDPLRWIAWKASAHQGDLVVRVFPPVRDRAHLLVLDLRLSTWPEAAHAQWVERALSLAAAWTLQAGERDEALGLYAWGAAVRFRPEQPPVERQGTRARSPARPAAEAGGTVGRHAEGAPVGAGTLALSPAGAPGRGAVDLPARRGARQRREVLRALALLHPADGPAFARGALAAMRRSPGSGVLWICGRADADVFAAAAAGARAGHAVALVVAGGGLPPDPPTGVSVWPLPLEEVGDA